MINQILILILVTFIPAIELRASIPLGILTGEINIFNTVIQEFGLPILLVLFVAILANIILGAIIYIILAR